MVKPSYAWEGDDVTLLGPLDAGAFHAGSALDFLLAQSLEMTREVRFSTSVRSHPSRAVSTSLSHDGSEEIERPMKKISRAHRFLAASLIVIAGVASAACGGSDDPVPEPGAPAASSGGGGAGGGGGGGTDPGVAPAPTDDPPPAVSGPSVVSTTPANGAKAVASNSTVVITFDRAMDQASVVAAYSSAELPSDAVTFSWSTGGDELTITPKSPLEYANGDPQVAAKPYAISFATTAKDKDGHPLSKEHAFSFTTLRRISMLVPMTSAMTGRALSNGTFSSVTLAAGDVMVAGTEREARAVFSFLMAIVPETGIELESATLKVAIASYDGTPEASLGGITTEQVFYSIGLEGFAAEPVSAASTSFHIAVGPDPAYRTADVTTIVQDDLANRVARNSRTQYRMRYLDGKNNDGATDQVTFDKANTTLTIVYVGE
jgi:hypothetical protein